VNGRLVARTASASIAPTARHILGMRVDATTYDDAASRIVRWAHGSESRYVCVAAVNNVMQAHEDDRFRQVMNDADLVTPDGMPLVWGLRKLGVKDATRVYGPDLTPVVLTMAERDGLSVGFYGGAPEVLESLLRAVRRRWPDLRVPYAYSPPYRPPTPDEDRRIVDDISASGAQILFVGLGCPKQETWMAAHRDRVAAPMVGVGAAFDFLAGTKRQAPAVVRNSGLEWVFRLVVEPGRLWKRYLHQNPRFAFLFAGQLARSWFASLSRAKGRESI
jgi:N-acetylglucosaminyldiphosphoundecaprenol N-acetyl-beta-D-mannosaminyltransferase